MTWRCSLLDETTLSMKAQPQRNFVLLQMKRQWPLMLIEQTSTFRSRQASWWYYGYMKNDNTKHGIYYNKPWQALTVPFPVGIISSLGRRHGIQFPTVSTRNKPYWIVTWNLIQLTKPSAHVQLKQAPENQLFPCSLTIPLSSVQAGWESLVQVIFPLRHLHLVLLLLSHSCPSAKAFPWKSQQPVCVFAHKTWKSGVHLQVKSGLGFQVCQTS